MLRRLALAMLLCGLSSGLAWADGQLRVMFYDHSRGDVLVWLWSDCPTEVAYGPDQDTDGWTYHEDGRLCFKSDGVTAGCEVVVRPGDFVVHGVPGFADRAITVTSCSGCSWAQGTDSGTQDVNVKNLGTTISGGLDMPEEVPRPLPDGNYWEGGEAKDYGPKMIGDETQVAANLEGAFNGFAFDDLYARLPGPHWDTLLEPLGTIVEPEDSVFTIQMWGSHEYRIHWADVETATVRSMIRTFTAIAMGIWVAVQVWNIFSRAFFKGKELVEGGLIELQQDREALSADAEDEASGAAEAHRKNHDWEEAQGGDFGDDGDDKRDDGGSMWG